jgi:hypothetical protein
MAYLGKYETRTADFKVYTSSTATATHTLSWTPTSKQSLRITINGVVQQDDAFSLTGNTVTLDAAILVTDVLEIVGVNELGGQVLVPADGSIQTGKLGDDAVTLAKMAGGTDGNLITYDASGDPAHVVTGSATHVLTSNGAGAAPTFQAAAAGGKVLQAVYSSLTATASTTSTSYVDSGLTATITPVSASNKVLVFLNTMLSQSGGNLIVVNILRGATVLISNTSGGVTDTDDGWAAGANHNSTGNNRISGFPSLVYLDSPATTSATIYKMQFLATGDTGYINQWALNTDTGGVSTLCLMEVAA